MPDSLFRETSSPFGVLAFLPWDHEWNFHHFRPEDVRRAAALMREAGIGFVRMDFLWSDLEPREGEFSWTRYDVLVNELRAQGLAILGVLNYNVSWPAASKPWYQAPDPDAFGRYARATVAHFKDRLRHWEIWNEPDHANYWQPQDHLKAYGRLLKRVYPLVKDEDPDSRVLMGGLSQALPAHLRLVYEEGGRNAFDIVNSHPFINPLAGQGLAQLEAHYRGVQKVMADLQDAQKPIWLTEIGCPGVPWLKRSPEASRWWLGESPGEEQQAEWLKQVYGTALKWPGVEKIFWAFFRDTPRHFGDGVDFLGLVREDFSKKPAFEAYRQIATTLR